MEQTIISIATPSDPASDDDDHNTVAALQASDGVLYRVTGDAGGDTWNVGPWCAPNCRPLMFPQMCAQMAVCRMDGLVGEGGRGSGGGWGGGGG